MNERDNHKNNQLLQNLLMLVTHYRDHLATIIKKKVGIDVRNINSKLIEQIELKHMASSGRAELFSSFLKKENDEVVQIRTMINAGYSKSIEQAIKKFKAIDKLYKILNADLESDLEPDLKNIDDQLDAFKFEFEKIVELLKEHRRPSSRWYASTISDKHITKGQKFISDIEHAYTNAGYESPFKKTL